MMPRIFLLSPAYLNGKRASFLKLGPEGAAISEIFSFISPLYFRAKVIYCQQFASPPEGLPGALVITACRGLALVDERLTREDVRQIAEVPIDSNEPRFREPLERDARLLAEKAGPECNVVLLGSVATAKYVEPLLSIFGERLLFPAQFAGRGDLSRGGLMLRHAREKVELEYLPVQGGMRRGPRPPRLPKL